MLKVGTSYKLTKYSREQTMKILASSIVSILIAAQPSAQSIASGVEQINYSETSVKGFKRTQGFPFDKVLPSVNGNSTKVLFNREYNGRICLISCHFYDGIISKWTNFYVDLQPYESSCSALAGGCTNTAFPEPPKSLVVKSGAKEFTINMVNPSQNSYYLPLSLRQALVAGGSDPVTLQTEFPKFPLYRLSAKTLAKLREVLDVTQEIDVKTTPDLQKTKADRLQELDQLLKTGLISEQEYRQARVRIIEE